MDKSACTKVVNYSKIKVEEYGRKVVFQNSDRCDYAVHTVDGCLITDGVRSDYLVSEKGVASVIVELKGKNVEHACEQVLATAVHPVIKPLLEKRLGFLIVCRRYPRFDTFVARAKSACMKQHRAGFHVVCDQRELVLERVVAMDGPY